MQSPPPLGTRCLVRFPIPGSHTSLGDVGALELCWMAVGTSPDLGCHLGKHLGDWKAGESQPPSSPSDRPLRNADALGVCALNSKREILTLGEPLWHPLSVHVSSYGCRCSYIVLNPNICPRGCKMGSLEPPVVKGPFVLIVKTHM